MHRHLISSSMVSVLLFGSTQGIVSQANVQCEQPGNPDGINLITPPVDLAIRYERQVLTADDTVEYMSFGSHTAMSGSWLAVSADLSPVTNKGFVSMYQFRDGLWQKAKTWDGPGQSPGDEFNWTRTPVALEDDLLIIGDSRASGDYGSAYLYQKDKGGNDAWGLLTAFNGGVADGRFGTQVKIDNRTLVISSQEARVPVGVKKGGVNLSSQGASTANEFEKGAVYVFDPDQQSPDTWIQSAELGVLDGYSSEAWLNGTEFSGNRLLNVVREGYDPANKALIWERDQDNWGFSAELSFPDSCQLRSAVIDGNTIVVNLLPPDAPSEEKTSALVFFERSETGTWERKFELDTTVYVGELALQGDRLVAAAIDTDTVGYVLTRQPESSQWQFVEKLMSSENIASPNSAISISGNRMAISALRYAPEGGEPAGVGAVLTYSLKDFVINPGLNDVWGFEDVTRQGFFFTVLPDSELIFLAWFTFDAERPPESVTAMLGGPGHRWLTALGPFEGNRAILDIEQTTGGIFDTNEIIPEQRYEGTIELEFDDCRSGTFTYNIPSIGRSRTIPIRREVNENVPWCEQFMQGASE